MVARKPVARRGKPGPKPGTRRGPLTADAATPPVPESIASFVGPNHLVADALSADHDLVAESCGDEALSYEALVEKIRSERAELGDQPQKLYYAPRPRYHRHWFNDSPGRIHEATRRGWAHVVDPTNGGPVVRVVSPRLDGLQGYLMEIPEVIWQEDMDARHRDAAAKVEATKAQAPQVPGAGGRREDAGAFYVPDDRGGPVRITTG